MLKEGKGIPLVYPLNRSQSPWQHQFQVTTLQLLLVLQLQTLVTMVTPPISLKTRPIQPHKVRRSTRCTMPNLVEVLCQDRGDNAISSLLQITYTSSVVIVLINSIHNWNEDSIVYVLGIVNILLRHTSNTSLQSCAIP